MQAITEGGVAGQLPSATKLSAARTPQGGAGPDLQLLEREAKEEVATVDNEASPTAHRNAGQPALRSSQSGGAAGAARCLRFAPGDTAQPHMLQESSASPGPQAGPEADVPPAALLQAFQQHTCLGLVVPAWPESSALARGLVRWLPQLPSRLLHVECCRAEYGHHPVEVRRRMEWLLQLLATPATFALAGLSIDCTLRLGPAGHLLDEDRRCKAALIEFEHACARHPRLTHAAWHHFHGALEHFLNYLPVDGALQRLDLRFNVLFYTTVQSLVRALARLPQLAELDLRHADFDALWAQDLLTAIEASKLTLLDVRGCSASPEIMERLRRLQQEQTRLTVLLD